MKYVYDVFGWEHNKALGFSASGIALGPKQDNTPEFALCEATRGPAQEE